MAAKIKKKTKALPQSALIMMIRATEVNDEHKNGGQGVQTLLPFLCPAELLGEKQHEAELHQLRGLDADAEEAEPAFVAGAAFHAPETQGEDQPDADDHQDVPALGQQVRIQDGKDEIQEHADDQSADLHHHIPLGLKGAGGAVEDKETENGVDQTKDEQEKVRAKQNGAESPQPLFHVHPPF